MSSNWPYSTGAAASAKLTHSRNRVKVQCPGCGRIYGENGLTKHAKFCHGPVAEYVPRSHDACALWPLQAVERGSLLPLRGEGRAADGIGRDLPGIGMSSDQFGGEYDGN